MDGGYQVSGQWQYASGSHHANWMAGSAIVISDGDPVRTASGAPEVRMLVFPAGEAEILDTWRVTGLRGTGSADLLVKDLFIPERHAFAMGPGPDTPRNASCQGPLYHLPIHTLGGMPMASVALGIAQHAADAFREFAVTKVSMGSSESLAERATTHARYGAAVAELRSARTWQIDVAERIWETIVAGEDVPTSLRADSLLACAHAVKAAAQVVDDVQLLGGGTAIYETNPIERCFRDIHTLTQNAAVSHRNLEVGGALLLGQPPSNPMALL